MGRLPFVKDPRRLGLYVPLGQTKESPSLVVPFYKMERGELDEIVRAALGEQGITDESTVQAIIDEAETQYEERRKVEEARQNLRKYMNLRKQGKKLMSIGGKKWREVHYPAINLFKGGK